MLNPWFLAAGVMALVGMFEELNSSDKKKALPAPKAGPPGPAGKDGKDGKPGAPGAAAKEPKPPKKPAPKPGADG